jgi:hypothetical protein
MDCGPFSAHFTFTVICALILTGALPLMTLNANRMTVSGFGFQAIDTVNATFFQMFAS